MLEHNHKHIPQLSHKRSPNSHTTQLHSHKQSSNTHNQSHSDGRRSIRFERVARPGPAGASCRERSRSGPQPKGLCTGFVIGIADSGASALISRGDIFSRVRWHNLCLSTEFKILHTGLYAANGVVIATVPSAFVDEISVQNIQSLTPNIGVVCSGVGPGSRVLVQASIEKARKYHELKKEQIPVIELVKETATVMQGFTQAPGILMAGYDEKGPHLYEVDPSGSRSSPKASAMGNNVTNTKTCLKRMFLEDMQLHVAVETAILTLRDGFEGQLSSQNIEIGVVGNDRVFKTLTPSEIDDYLRRMK